MKETELIDALVASYKKQDAMYPEAVALGALKAKFSSFLWYVEDLLSAIESGTNMSLALAVHGVKGFLARLEEEAKA